MYLSRTPRCKQRGSSLRVPHSAPAPVSPEACNHTRGAGVRRRFFPSPSSVNAPIEITPGSPTATEQRQLIVPTPTVLGIDPDNDGTCYVDKLTRCYKLR